MLAPNLKSKISSLAHPMGEGRLPSDLSTEALLAKEGGWGLPNRKYKIQTILNSAFSPSLSHPMGEGRGQGVL